MKTIFSIMFQLAISLLLLVINSALLLGCFDTKKADVKNAETCAECTASFCQEAAATCSDSPECQTRQTCIDDCQSTSSSTGECDESCSEGLYDLFGQHTDISLCQGDYCADLCQRNCGGFVYLKDTCKSCAELHCCEESTACAGDPVCLAIQPCWANCIPGDWGCYEDCDPEKGADAGSGSVTNEYRNCLYNKCYDQCEAGQLWSCVGNDIDLPAADPTREIEVAVGFYDMKTHPIPDVRVTMCMVNDPDCNSPLETAQSDSNGWATLTYKADSSTNFVHFQISKPGHVPARLIYSRRLTGSPYSLLVFLPTLDELDSLAEHLGITAQPGRGHAFISLFDCSLAPANGLIVSAPDSEGIKTFYVKDFLPDLSAQYTSKSGEAVIANLPPGSNVIEAAHFENPDVGVIRESIRIYPDSITYAFVWPK